MDLKLMSDERFEATPLDVWNTMEKFLAGLASGLRSCVALAIAERLSGTEWANETKAVWCPHGEVVLYTGRAIAFRFRLQTLQKGFDSKWNLRGESERERERGKYRN